MTGLIVSEEEDFCVKWHCKYIYIISIYNICIYREECILQFVVIHTMCSFF